MLLLFLEDASYLKLIETDEGVLVSDSGGDWRDGIESFRLCYVVLSETEIMGKSHTIYVCV